MRVRCAFRTSCNPLAHEVSDRCELTASVSDSHQRIFLRGDAVKQQFVLFAAVSATSGIDAALLRTSGRSQSGPRWHESRLRAASSGCATGRCNPSLISIIAERVPLSERKAQVNDYRVRFQNNALHAYGLLVSCDR